MQAFSLFSVISVILLVPKGIQADADNYNEKVAAVVHLVEEVNLINGTTNVAGWDVQPVGTEFPCDLFEWSKPADNVNELTPYDVSVVGAIGDSMTAAFAAGSKSIFDILNEFRGVSWSIGGDDDLSAVATLPNVIKKYNPDLKGFSVKTGGPDSENAHLNVAVSGAKAKGIKKQAETLVAKMKEDKAVDFENDWKVVTLWIGGNDLCISCVQRTEHSPDNYIEHIKETLDFLQENMPRTLVNVVQIIDIGRIAGVTGIECSIFQAVLCPCSTTEGNRKFVTDYALQYQENIRELINSGRYDIRNDFTVVLQPFMAGIEVPMKDGKPDKSYAAPDCFHFSTKSQGLAGVALWNNMVQRVGEKEVDWSLEGTLQCPTKDRPYFYTNTNSRSIFVAVQSDSLAGANEEQNPPLSSDGNSLGVTIGTVTVLVICVILAVAVFALVVYRFKKRRGQTTAEKIRLMENKF